MCRERGGCGRRCWLCQARREVAEWNGFEDRELASAQAIRDDMKAGLGLIITPYDLQLFPVDALFLSWYGDTHDVGTNSACV